MSGTHCEVLELVYLALSLAVADDAMWCGDDCNDMTKMQSNGRFA
jgi:hypothetical protein